MSPEEAERCYQIGKLFSGEQLSEEEYKKELDKLIKGIWIRRGAERELT